MFNFLAATFGRHQTRPPPPSDHTDDGALGDAVRFRPRLTAQLLRDHEVARQQMRALLDAHYPRVAEASRLRERHEAASGHSLKGWWILSQYGLDR